MNPRAFLKTLSELEGKDQLEDWVNATNAHVHAEWTSLVRSPLPLFVDEEGRIALEGFDEHAVRANKPLPFAMPSRTAADAASLVHTLGQEVCAALGVQDSDPDEYTGYPGCARLVISVDEANSIAARIRAPIRFVKALSPASAWEVKTNSGATFGMDDPVWMAKTQEAIDASLYHAWRGKSAGSGRNE